MADFNPVMVVPIYMHGSAFTRMLPTLLPFGMPVIIVDDGSDSDNAKLLEALEAKHDQLHLTRHSHNRGKGAAVATALKKAQTMGFTHALQIDGDGQHDVNDIPAFLSASCDNPHALILGVPQYA